MIEFNKLFVVPYNGGLYIDCQVMNMSYYNNVYIDKIVIDTQDTFTTSGISNNPIYTYQVSGNLKQVQLTIKNEQMDATIDETTMFFVYVVTKGTPSSSTPCGMDNSTTLGVSVNTYSIYRKAINYISQVYNKCDIPKHFIDFILRYRAFQVCLKAKDYRLAITYWKKFTNSNHISYANGCRCNE